MKVHELITQLQEYNQEAEVTTNIKVTYSEYTSGDEDVPITGTISWPHNDKASCTRVEITHE